MVSPLQSNPPKQKFFDNSGVPLTGGKLFTYAAGTATKLTTYTDSTGNTANNNPIILNSRGECDLWFDPAQVYKLVLSPSTDTDPPSSPIWSVDQVVSPAAQTVLQVASYGANVANSAAANTTAFNAAIAALPSGGGKMIVGGSGNFLATAASIVVGAKRVRWQMPQGATVNSTQAPEIPGEWVSPSQTVAFFNGGTIGTYQYGINYQVLLQAGSAGHFQNYVSCDSRSAGVASTFYTGLQGFGGTASNGNVTGLNGYAQVRAGANAATEAVGAEMDTDVRTAVARKTGLQVVDVATSTASGVTFDAAIWIAKQAGAVGYKNGIQFGDATDTGFPLFGNAAAMVSGNIASQAGVTIGYGFRPAKLAFTYAAVQLQSQYTGHSIGWAAAGGSGIAAGEIRSDVPGGDGGAVIFVSGGLSLQASNAGSRFEALKVLNDSTNAVSILCNGVNRQILPGAVDSGGAGYRLLRITNA